jgi:hypothetical protein
MEFGEGPDGIRRGSITLTRYSLVGFTILDNL